MKKVVSIMLAFILVWVCVFSAAATETEIGQKIQYDENGDGSYGVWECIKQLVDPYTVGDADNDGDVDLTDYSMVKNYLTTGEGKDSIDQQADVNFDGAYDAFDLFMIDKWITLGAQTTYVN